MRRSAFSLLFLAILISVSAQSTKKTLGWDDIESWRRITETVMSPDGNFIAWKSEPWKGDTRVKVYDKKGVEKGSWECATSIQFTWDSRWMFFTIKPSAETVRQNKIMKTKREDLPGDTLAMWSVAGGLEKIPSIRSYRLPAKWSGWVAWQAEPAKASPAGNNSDKLPAKRESASNGYTLNIKNLVSGKIHVLPFVTDYQFAEEKPLALFVSTGDDKEFAPGLYLFDAVKEEVRLLKGGKGTYRQVSLNKSASSVAFLFNGNESDKLGNEFALFHGKLDGEVTQLLDKSSLAQSDGWIISEGGRLSFSDSGNRLFFATAPANRQRDTVRLDEDWPNVDIWHWNEGTLHTQQVVNRNRDARRSYQAVYNFSSGNVVQLATPSVPGITLINSGDSDIALAVTNEPYQVESMWDSTPGRNDVYLMNITDGKTELLKKGFRGRMQPSQGGKYLLWFTAADSSWYSINLSDKKEQRITNPSLILAADETNDVPNPPGSYSIAGWLKDDQAVLVYDRYDIWKVDPSGSTAPVRITTNGREKSIVYRVMRLDRDQEFFSPSEKLFLSGHNDITRGEGYYALSLNRPGVPAVLMSGDYRLGTPQKARNAGTVVFSMETFKTFPDLHVTDTEFRKPVRISDVNPQQKDFIWGSAEVVSWSSLDGFQVDGLLFRPENFDPAKKYPMIVNFYDKSSQGLHNYKNPELHRSTIDYHYYTSNGYLVFNPDIHYRDGYPGESAYNCIMPGVTALIATGFVDPARIGAQGHSWGGYQVAYMATRTGLFAAIESGAPVVNMFSAYGGIRWETGLNRAFQYEHQQSRIGLSIWESPLRYLENSPLFTMDKVTTPILIMANDQDGHVPWYQGIEYFIALRRLGKPAWMLNYTGEPHWPQKPQNKKDFQIRMAQFFDHFLKGTPMPLWMKEGIPAVDKEFELGYGFR